MFLVYKYLVITWQFSHKIQQFQLHNTGELLVLIIAFRQVTTAVNINKHGKYGKPLATFSYFCLKLLSKCFIVIAIDCRACILNYF